MFSIAEIPNISNRHYRKLELLLLYLHADLCSKFGATLPAAALKFMDTTREFPATFQSFEKIATQHEHRYGH